MKLNRNTPITPAKYKLGSLLIIILLVLTGCSTSEDVSIREKVSINQGWKFMKYESAVDADRLIYDVRPEITTVNDAKPADSKPTEAEQMEAKETVLKAWIMPSGNDFISNLDKKYTRPNGNPGADFPFVQTEFNDGGWESVDLPHDWAIAGPFYEDDDPEVGGGMGRLPSPGVAWYRKKLDILPSDADKSIFLDIDGAMSYAMVWLNGNLVGGWPYGYNSFRLDLTPYIQVGGENQLAIRLDNPNHSARWYPGGGIYRNVWLVKTARVHVAQWGTFITTPEITETAATVNLELKIENDAGSAVNIDAVTEIYELDADGNRSEIAVASFEPVKTDILPGQTAVIETTAKVAHPKLWGPPPTQTPNLYVAVTTLFKDHEAIDDYQTEFGIRSVAFDPNQGVLVNGELVKLKGVNNHHDLGAIGSAFNTRAAERQLEILAEMGTNSVRMAHNPPAPELLELTDKMGFMVMDEVFDSWERKKTPHDFHLIFPDWYEQDLRSMLRRDRNHPSIIMWSYGNEVGEQYTDAEGAAIGQKLVDIVKQEDSTRPTTSAMNWAKPHMPFPEVMDVISLNYQGEGIRQDPMFEGTDRIRTPPQYDPYHEKFPNKVVLTSESASAFSSRGIYYFPVSQEFSAPARDGRGGNSEEGHVTAYELHAVDFGSTAQKVFRAIDQHPFVAGEFVWTGFDYLGEPTPYYAFRSSYNGMIDLAGFKKDRFYQYQAKWRPDYPMVHILPHWNWPERVGEITPIHIFTSGDEVEVFLNGESLGRKKMGEFEYRIRYDEVLYAPGEVKAIAYKNGKVWAEEVIKTSEEPASIVMEADRTTIKADGYDLSYITVQVQDADGNLVPNATNWIEYSVEGPGEIIATDNGDPTDFTPFPSHKRKLFSGKGLVVVRSVSGKAGAVRINATSGELESAKIVIQTER